MDSGNNPDILYINDKKVIEFYKNHKNLDFNKINIIIVQLLESSVSYGNHDTHNHAENFINTFEEFKKDIKVILQTTSNDKITDTIKDYMEMFKDKTKLLLNSDNTIMLQEIHSIKNEFNDKISMIKDITLHNKTEQTELLSDISKLVQKMGGSSDKGRLSEQTVLQLLYNLYPSGSIENVTKQKESGDFLLKRENKYDIMIENKIYNKSVDDVEVNNFLRDGRKNNISGIMLSQQCGISNKKNYQIDVMDNNVYVYVHSVFHDPNKIKIAVDIIDNLKKQLDLMVTDKNICMDKSILDKINKEFNEIVVNKQNQYKLLEEYTKNMKKYIDTIKLPNLGDFLTENGGSININNEFKCEVCNKTLSTNIGLQNHKRVCKKLQVLEIK